MEWSTDMALQLVDEYENFPILWDAKHKDHFSRNKKLDAWEAISNNLKIEVNQVKQKMFSLLGSFRREKAKGKRSIGTGKGRQEVYISKWFAFERMQYLLDKDDPRDTLDTEKTRNLSNEEKEADPEIPDNTDQNTDAETTEQPDNETDLTNEKFTTPVRPKKRRIRSDKSDDSRLEEAFNILKQSVAQKELPPDECSVYSQYVANKLKSYDKRTRAQVEHAINNIIFNADMGMYDTASCSNLQTQNVNTTSGATSQYPVYASNKNSLVCTVPSPLSHSNSSNSTYCTTPTESLSMIYENL